MKKFLSLLFFAMMATVAVHADNESQQTGTGDAVSTADNWAIPNVWPGHAPGDVKVSKQPSSADTDYNQHDIYLYNVGTGQFLNFGGYWGTQPALHSWGQPLYLLDGWTDSNITQGSFRIGAYIKVNNGENDGESYIGYVRKKDSSGSWVDQERLYIDRQGAIFTGSVSKYDGVVNVYFEPVNGRNKVYHLCIEDYPDLQHNGSGAWANWTKNSQKVKRYFTVGHRDDAHVVSAEPEGSGFDPSLEKSMWVIVTREDMLNRTKNVDAATDLSFMDLSFLMYDKEFTVNNTHSNEWKKEGNAAIATYGDSKNGGLIVPEGVKDAEQIYNNKFMAATLSSATDKVYQDVKIPAATNDYNLTGWYLISCQGLNTAENGGKLFVTLLDKDGNQTGDVLTRTFEAEPSISVKHVYRTSEDGEPIVVERTTDLTKNQYVIDVSEHFDATGSKHRVGVLIYAKAGETIRVGAMGADNCWTVFDDFTVNYEGNTQNILFDEDCTEIAHLKKQVATDKDETKAAMLFLKRTFNIGKWNSFVLPVNLTKQEVLTAFGSFTKLSKLEKYDAATNTIVFKSVEFEKLKPGDEALREHELYIIRPSQGPNLSFGEGEGQIAPRTIRPRGYGENETETLEGDYYLIPLVHYTKVVEDKFEPVELAFTAGKTIYKDGTWVKNANVVPQHSFVIQNDKWHQYVGTKGMGSKGFRAWIEVKDDNVTPGTQNDNVSESLKFIIDGIEMGGGETSEIRDALIAPKAMPGAVYSLQGQLLRTDGSTEGLPKGVYVIDGKKKVVE